MIDCYNILLYKIKLTTSKKEMQSLAKCSPAIYYIKGNGGNGV